LIDCYLPGGFLRQSPLILISQNLAGDRSGGLNDQSPNFPPQFSKHPCVVGSGGLARLSNNLLGGGNSFLCFLLLDLGCGFPRFFDQLGRLVIGLR